MCHQEAFGQATLGQMPTSVPTGGSPAPKKQARVAALSEMALSRRQMLDMELNNFSNVYYVSLYFIVEEIHFF